MASGKWRQNPLHIHASVVWDSSYVRIIQIFLNSNVRITRNTYWNIREIVRVPVSSFNEGLYEDFNLIAANACEQKTDDGNCVTAKSIL